MYCVLTETEYAFRSEGFTAKIVLTFKSKASQARNLEPLRSEIKDGYLGNIQVEPELRVAIKKSTFLEDSVQ